VSAVIGSGQDDSLANSQFSIALRSITPAAFGDTSAPAALVRRQSSTSFCKIVRYAWELVATVTLSSAMTNTKLETSDTHSG
jgi:hypothetical protein